ncbi:MAG TPA: STAS domain-containing protein [Sedimentisphaerales bacterium]|nr:STAS domain-containing protein [Sedimentisphaerales bacterium]
MTELKPKITVEYSEKATIVTLADERILEEGEIRSLQEAIMSVIEQAGRINMVLDFRNVRFLSSAVLGLLVRISKKIYEYEGQLKLCNIDRKIHEVFKITRLTKIFDIHEDLESALESFS